MNKDAFWWTPHELLTYNCLYNFVVGNRGGGKTFGMREFTIRKALEKGEEFVYLRRTDVELDKAKKSFFKSIVKANKFPDWCFRIRGDEAQAIEADEDGNPSENCQWRTIGYLAFLSGARTQKSFDTPDVKYLIYDEFIIPEAGINSYLPDEVNVFLEFYESVARMRDVIVFFTANALTTINPYFLYFNVSRPKNGRIGRLKEDIAYELVINQKYTEAKKATRFGKLIAGTEFEKYAIDNEFVWDNSEEEIASLDKTFTYFLTLVWEKKPYGVYRSYEHQQIIISPKFDITYVAKLEITLKNGKINKLMMSQLKKYYHLNTLFDYFIKGFVRYENKNVKAAMDVMFRKLF